MKKIPWIKQYRERTGHSMCEALLAWEERRRRVHIDRLIALAAEMQEAGSPYAEQLFDLTAELENDLTTPG